MGVIEEVSEILRNKKLKIAIAESCTGGFLSHTFTNIPGASDFFLIGMVVYTSETKKRFLSVHEETLLRYGPVSAEIAEEMCSGVKNLVNADIGISTTGFLPSNKGVPEGLVGKVFIGIAGKQLHVFEKKFTECTRAEMKIAIADFVIKKLLEIIKKEF